MAKTQEKLNIKRDYTQIFSWGNDKHGQLGLGTSGEEYA
jgi:alpha-tubulin suppressor-like RCC1 family protein